MAILFFSFLFLGWFLFQPITDVFIHEDYSLMNEYGHKITRKELDAFLDVWSDMMNSTFKESYNNNSLKKEKLVSFQKWLKLKRWNIDRFFYDEQRIRDILTYLDVKAKLEGNRKIAKKSSINLDNITSDLEKHLDHYHYDEKELSLIEANIYQIVEILSGRAVLEH